MATSTAPAKPSALGSIIMPIVSSESKGRTFGSGLATGTRSRAPIVREKAFEPNGHPNDDAHPQTKATAL